MPFIPLYDFPPNIISNDLTVLKRRNWQISSREHKDVYSLTLMTLGNASPGARSRLSDLYNGNALEYKFKMNPKSMDLEEPFAATIRPTQGGQFIEHQGIIYKNITISGTTGLRPNPVPTPSPGLIGSLANAFGVGSTPPVDFETGLPVGEVTGFEDLINLRNLFRVYGMAKVDPELAPSTVMVWKNGKEGEYYIVEPLTFKTARDSGSPLTASYTITLKTISRLENFLSNIITDSYLRRNSNENQRFIINQFIQNVANALNVINQNLDAGLSSVARLITDVLTPTNELLSAVSAIGNTSKRITQIPRFAVMNLASNIAEARAAVSQLMFVPKDAYILGQEVNAEFGVYNISRSLVAASLRGIHWSINSILTIPSLFDGSFFKPNIKNRLNSKKSLFINDGSNGSNTGGDPLSISNISIGNAYSQAVVGSGDTIRKIAKRLLGSASRWKELVIINNLKAPYISDDGDGVSILRTGDPILYSVSSADRKTAVAEESILSTSPSGSQTLTPIQERLGRDIKLKTVTSDDGIDFYDFEVNDNGDIATIDGLDNMEQAVVIKFNTEQGELPAHPFFGIKHPIGVKMSSPTSFSEFDVNARGTLLSDPRIDRINSFDISFAGNTLNVKGDILIKGFDNTLGFDFSTRR